MDGDAAHNNGERPVIRASNDCGFNLLPEEKQAIIEFGDLDWKLTTRTIECNSETNKALGKHNGYLFTCDLEWALFNGASK